MRKIRYRGKSVKTGQWIEGYYALQHIANFDAQGNRVEGFAEHHAIYNDEDGERNNGGYWQDILPETLGQFTGVHSKDGKPIYEGDIVECVSWNEYFSKDGQTMEPFRRKMYVDFRKGGFKMVEPMPAPLKDNEWDIIYNGDIVIIGNIHDNPQLIDSKRL